MNVSLEEFKEGLKREKTERTIAKNKAKDMEYYAYASMKHRKLQKIARRYKGR